LSVSCPICGKGVQSKFRLRNEVYYCPPCDLFLSSGGRYDKLKEENLNLGEWFEKISAFRRRNYKAILEQLKGFNLKGRKGLEVGSAYGAFLEVSKEYDFEVTGLEPEERMVARSIQKDLRVIKGFFPADLPGERAGYDFLVFNDVFEHIPDCNDTLRHCKLLLRDAGVLILNLPLSSGIFYRIATGLYFLGFKAPLQRLWQFDFYTPHLYYFNRNSLETLLRKHDLEVFHYLKLETIDGESLYYRIKIDPLLSKYSFLLSKLIILLKGAINMFSEDTGVFFIRKRLSGGSS
jgi:SAM-dependent methyltransferase